VVLAEQQASLRSGILFPWDRDCLARPSATHSGTPKTHVAFAIAVAVIVLNWAIGMLVSARVSLAIRPPPPWLLRSWESPSG
jgi:hypothetical protein